MEVGPHLCFKCAKFSFESEFYFLFLITFYRFYFLTDRERV